VQAHDVHDAVPLSEPQNVYVLAAVLPSSVKEAYSVGPPLVASWNSTPELGLLWSTGNALLVAVLPAVMVHRCCATLYDKSGGGLS
jgi:hypothetical protein